jgi:hypothetical protein
MAASGFTPISLYYSTTGSAAPTSGNLVDGELAINITDGKMFYKDNLGAVQVIADKNFVTLAGTQTLTNKRINPRVVAAGATSGNLTPNGDTTDVFNAFGLTGAITLLAPSGTPVDGQRIILRFEDNGVARAITWTITSGAYRAVGATLPTTTAAGKVTYVGCVYNSTDIFWDVVAVATQA